MKLAALSLLSLGLVSARAIDYQKFVEQVPVAPQHGSFGQNPPESRLLIERAPGDTLWVTEEQKWALRRVSRFYYMSSAENADANANSQAGIHFIDITAETAAISRQPPPPILPKKKAKFPFNVAYPDAVLPLTTNLSKTEMEEHLTKFSSFYTRYYKSSSGSQSATWLHEQVHKLLVEAGAIEAGATVERFEHPWGQPSVIARIPGTSPTNATVVIGAHQDSINLLFPALLPAPGADDDGSGSVTILEALRVLLLDETIARGGANNTVEFHWYSAEEGGLLGSQAVFAEYNKQKRQIRAMLQQDMTGYAQGMLDAGEPEAVGVITDYVDADLVEFIKKVITAVCLPLLLLSPCIAYRTHNR